MIVVEKQFNVILSDDELDFLTTALHGEYKTVRDRIRKTKEGQEVSQRDMDRMNTCHNLRNEFADLIGRKYMGEDA